MDLLTITEDKELRDKLDGLLAKRYIDVSKIKTGDTPMLIMIGSAKRPAYTVPLSGNFLFHDHSYVLDAGAFLLRRTK